MAYLIYGKVVKPVSLPDGKGGRKMAEPQPTFRALNFSGQRVSRLADAGVYEDKSLAEKIINRAKKHWEEMGYKDCILYEIRRSK
jgi:hypothetical protein